MKKVHIVGSGFSSLSASAYLAQEGFEVHVFEKNDSIGGRARKMHHKGFTFDMGPSWYWMPDVFERYFKDFNHTASDFYELIRLNPSYKVVFGKDDQMDMPSNIEDLKALFEQEEAGSADALDIFLKSAAFNYKVAIQNLVYKPGKSPSELVSTSTLFNVNQFFMNVQQYVRKHFKSERLRKILEFPVLFLGAKPSNTPLFYNFMNYADLVLGTWYPKGGMFEIVKAMQKIAEDRGVIFHTNAEVNEIVIEQGKAVGLKVNDEFMPSDYVLSGADYHHTETLINEKHRQYSEKYWNKKTFAPSALIFYAGFDKNLKDLEHHNLFFDEDFEQHAVEIYDKPKWPSAPLFYANFSSKTDANVAPAGQEGGFFLIPLAPGLEDSPELHDYYWKIITERIKSTTGVDLAESVLFKKVFSVADFKSEYNSYKGNAYGMANTLKQTAFLRPRIVSKRVANLFFTGQLTVPGPGVPPAIISGKIAAQEILKLNLKQEAA